ncbi:MAG: cytochrome c3 family protein [Pyrinomonadaceae bacterium]
MKNAFRIAVIVMTAVVFAAGLLDRSSAQQRRGGFDHATAAHKKQSCNSCHKVPTPNWSTARGFPDVADFPGHASCVNCHRRDFFNPPAICAGCHTNPGPRGVARKPFPPKGAQSDFAVAFPHDKHQNILAFVDTRQTRSEAVAVAHFAPMRGPSADVDGARQYNSCAVCHVPYAQMPKFKARDLVRAGQTPLAAPAAESLSPKPEFFMTAPSSHASCFTCHYQTVEPIRSNCAGCHKLSPSPVAASEIIRRYSIKFDHQQKDHAGRDCASCHIRITQNTDVRTMLDADVPILTCSTSSCHSKHLGEEIGKREDSIAAKQSPFQCTYCHSTEIGRFPVPATHRPQ